VPHTLNIAGWSEMADSISLVARLLAFQSQHAVPIVSQRQLVLQPHALVLCTLAMAGEDTTVHAVAVGRVGEPAQVRVVPDPRIRDDHYALFEWLADRVEPYFLWCREQGDFPQIWVSSGAGIAHLDTLADRLRYNQHNSRARRLGELLSYSTERSPVSGQQALLSATGALRLHFATGQQEGEDEHLGALLTWVHPPAGQDVQTSVEFAERQPMGVNTDPEFDATRLAPRLADYNAARRREAPPKEMAQRAALITQMLSPIIEPIYAAVQRAYVDLQNFSKRESDVVSALRRIESQRFEYFMRARDADMHLPYRDKPKGAAFRIAEREHMVEVTEVAAIHSDSAARARAFLRGDILRGTVIRADAEKVPHRSIYRVEVRTQQRFLRIRPRDTLASLADGRLRFQVIRSHRRGKWTIVALTITAGMKCLGCPEVGTVVELGPQAPDWDHGRRERSQMSERLAVAPWTHTTELPAAAAPREGVRPANLVADVEGLP
jgi:hypothetical protein